MPPPPSFSSCGSGRRSARQVTEGPPFWPLVLGWGHRQVNKRHSALPSITATSYLTWNLGENVNSSSTILLWSLQTDRLLEGCGGEGPLVDAARALAVVRRHREGEQRNTLGIQQRPRVVLVVGCRNVVNGPVMRLHEQYAGGARPCRSGIVVQGVHHDYELARIGWCARTNG